MRDFSPNTQRATWDMCFILLLINSPETMPGAVCCLRLTFGDLAKDNKYKSNNQVISEAIQKKGILVTIIMKQPGFKVILVQIKVALHQVIVALHQVIVALYQVIAKLVSAPVFSERSLSYRSSSHRQRQETQRTHLHATNEMSKPNRHSVQAKLLIGKATICHTHRISALRTNCTVLANI